MQETIAFHINLLQRSFIKFSEQKLKEKGLSKGQLPFILYVGKHVNCSQAELKHKLKIDWGYSQRAIAKLIDDGFMKKEHSQDSDCYELQLTTKGEDAFDVCHRTFEEWDTQNLTALSDDEKKLLMSLLQRIVPTIENR